jgi:succinoglycan biosynthesis transport protein ExoP
MDILVLFRVLLRKKWYLILIPIVAAIATYFFTSGMKPVYVSVAKLATGFTTDEEIKITDDRFNVRDAEVKFNNLLQTITSESVLSLLSYRLILNDLTSPKPFRPLREGEEGRLSFTPEERKRAIAVFQQKYDSIQLLSSFDPFEKKLLTLLAQQNYAGWQMKDQVDVKNVKGTDFLTIQFGSTNPLLSAFVVNALGEEYIRYENSLRSTRSDKSVTFFESLVKEKKKLFDDKTELLNQFKVSNNVIDYETESTTKMSQITEYELRKEQIMSDVQRIRFSLNNVNRKLAEFGKTGSDQDRATTNANIVRIKEKIAQLTDEDARTGSKNEQLQATIRDLRFQLQVEMSKLEQTGAASTKVTRQDLLDQQEQYQLELQIAEANLSNVNGMISSLRGSVTGYASKEAAITALQSEVDKAKEEYLQALDRFNTEQSKSMIHSSSVRIIIRGQPNGYPEFSMRYLLVALSGVVTFVLCVFVIIFMEYIDVRIKNPQQFRKMVRIPLAGAVNSIDTKNLNLTELFANSNKNQDMEVFKHFLRKLRFEIEASKGKVLLVSSTKPGEGKTFIILCVAYLLSLIQKHVLIIDTNFKNNSLTHILLRKNQNVRKLEQGIFIKGYIGQSEKHDMSEEDFASSIVYPTGHRGISIIGNNGGSESPSEIFAGRDFGEMIRKLSETYDYIIMEGAALNNYSDTKELVDYADKVLTVFSADSVIKQLDRESIDYLKNLNGKFMGAVLNKINTKELAI